MRKLCFDLGGTSIKCGIIDNFVLSDFHIIDYHTYNLDEFIDIFVNTYNKYEDIDEICISKHGYGYSQRYDVIGDILSERLNIRVTMENDITGATNAEYLYGSLKGVKNGLCIVVGAGIGVGCILDSKLICKDNMNDVDIELYKSYKEITEDLYNKCSSKALSDDCISFFEDIDDTKNEIFNRYCNDLKEGIDRFIELHDFERICICGGISNNSILYNRIKEISDFNIVESKYKGYAGLYGAYIKSL